MPAATGVLAHTNVVVDRTTHTIRLTRTFAAPRELVFEAWTKPEHVACWWDAEGTRLTECEIDLRPGGAFTFANRHRPDAPPFTGIYREIVPPERIVFDAIGAIGRVVLETVGMKTLLTVTIECGSKAMLDQYLQLGVDVGTSQTLDNLVAYVGTLKR